MRNMRIGYRRNIGGNGKPVVVYKDGELVGSFKSESKAAKAIGVDINTIINHIKSGTPTQNGYTFLPHPMSPATPIAKSTPDILPEDDLPVASFDREDDMMLAEYKSVTLLAKCLQRPIKTVLGWLKGERCTDPDCYYKYIKDCTQQELNNRYKL